MDIETDGLVIREYPKGERDKLLIVLTPEMGRISVWARGARSPKSPLLSVSQLLSYSRL
ncbi:MAG: recombination protein O N-terminal domain-containing protein, partial [Clostridia bacterium]|nr:recombination protein O N-terminal domain-containing protein [Clostridia bacterium]